MYNKIIIALSLEHGFSQTSLELARKLKNEGGKIIAVHVSEPLNDVARLYVAKEDIEKAQKATQSDLDKRIENQQDVEAVILLGHPGREIPDYARKIGADCIIVGSHKPGLEDFFLGSTSSRVVRHARCAVHVLR